MPTRFWRRDRTAPYATLLSVIERYVHPEVDELDTLKRAVRRPDLEEMHTFKDELRQAVRDPNVLPEGTLFLAGAFEDGSDQAFLDRLWHDLYGDEPV